MKMEIKCAPQAMMGLNCSMRLISMHDQNQYMWRVAFLSVIQNDPMTNMLLQLCSSTYAKFNMKSKNTILRSYW